MGEGQKSFLLPLPGIALGLEPATMSALHGSHWERLQANSLTGEAQLGGSSIDCWAGGSL